MEDSGIFPKTSTSLDQIFKYWFPIKKGNFPWMIGLMTLVGGQYSRSRGVNENRLSVYMSKIFFVSLLGMDMDKNFFR